MSNVVAFTPRPRPSEPDAPAPLAGLALRAHLEEAAQTALDTADKIIAALDQIEGATEPEAIKTAPTPRPVVSAQIVRIGDLGSFATNIARLREEAAEPEIRVPFPAATVGRRWQRRGRRRLCSARTCGEAVMPKACPISDTSVSKQIQSNISPYLK